MCRRAMRCLPASRTGMSRTTGVGREVGRIDFNGGKYALVDGEGIYPVFD